MPRIEVRAANGMFYRADLTDLHAAGDWLVKTLQLADCKDNYPATVNIYPMYLPSERGVSPDWPQGIEHEIYPVMNLRSLIDRLQAIEKEQQL